tara:strand:- start:1448 stop:1558 length:111 start_codon:yes stop_codon:yes gene_type:complete
MIGSKRSDSQDLETTLGLLNFLLLSDAAAREYPEAW